MEKKRDEWSGTFGFIMASAGSAVGLGNLWKFPYLAGMYGGGLFVIVYLLMVFAVGFTLILGELAVGRYAKSNAVTAFNKINPKFTFVGYLGVLASFVILSFYSVVGGWILKYIYLFITGDSFADSSAQFEGFISSGMPPAVMHIIFLLICVLIVIGGISKGIEKASAFMMPALFVMIIVVAIAGMSLDGASKGIEFYLKPNPESFSLKTISVAFGQVFFSLSLGMGTLVTYGSYLSKKERLVKSTAVIVGLDTLVALLAGFAILPAVFALNMQPDSGPSLMFITLPKVFMQMPGGRIIGIIFFILLIFAAITSVISLLEVIITYFIEKHNMKRITAALITGAILAVTGIFAALSQGPLDNIKILGKNIFDFLDMLSSNILLPIGGLMLCIIVGFIWTPKNAVAEITNGGEISFKTKNIWIVLIKYIMPVCIILIMLDTFGVFG